MEEINSNKKRNFTLFILILSGESIFFLPFVLARIFRPTLLAVFQISNTELGIYFSVYGIVAMISYVFGGTLADRFPARKLMSVALVLTSIGGFAMAMVPGSGVMKLIYGFYGFTSIFLFWAALIRATREWGGSGFQGRAFGWLEGGRGATAALLGTFALLLFSAIPGENPVLEAGEESFHAFQWVIVAASVFTGITGILVWYFVPENSNVSPKSNASFQLKDWFELFRLPKIWLLSVMIVCAYVGYKITDDYSLFAREVLGYSEVAAAGVGTLALWMRAVVAILAGYLADRLKHLRVMSICYGFAVISGGLIGMGVFNQIAAILILNLSLTMVGVYGVRALYFAILQDAGIPLRFTGSAVGIVSFIGFTPDVFMSPWMGYLLDNHPGATGHRYVFIVLAGFSCIGFISTLVFKRIKNRQSEQVI